MVIVTLTVEVIETATDIEAEGEMVATGTGAETREGAPLDEILPDEVKVGTEGDDVSIIALREKKMRIERKKSSPQRQW